MAQIMVSGATGGIGSALVAQLRERGDQIIAVGRHPEKIADLAARTARLDLDSLETIAPAVEALGLDRLDALIHCAGTISLGPVAGTSAQSWRQQLNVNLAGPAELTRATLPALRAAGGHVVFLNFWIGPLAKPGWSAYAAGKFGLRALADALRGEEEPRGLKVTSLYPSCVATEMQRGVREAFGREYKPEAYIQPETVARMIISVLETPADARLTDVTIGLSPEGQAS